MSEEVRLLHVIDQEGKRHTVEGLDGWRIMEIIRDQGLPIKAECGGACACATCHVYVSAAWREKLYAQTAEELERLEEDAFMLTEDSRLSCQILMSAALDGLEVTLAPGTEP